MFTQILQKYLPPSWNFTDIYDYRQNLLPRNSTIYQRLASSMSSINGLNITRISQVENPYMFGQFLLKIAEYETRGKLNIVELFHATGAHNVHSILSNNLDWRLVQRVKFGSGISFSPYADYAHKKASWTCGTDRAMIIADVLIGKEENVSYSPLLPRYGFDTTTGNNKHVIVKYYDNEFFLKHVVYYNNSNMYETPYGPAYLQGIHY